MTIDRKLRESVASIMINDMLHFSSKTSIPDGDLEKVQVESMDSKLLATLIEKNFKRIDLNGDGISRKELALALSSPKYFTNEEFMMLRLISKYFDSIASLCDDQAEGEKLRITKLDKDVLVQFLQFSNMTLQDIHNWLALHERSVTPPPSSQA